MVLSDGSVLVMGGKAGSVLCNDVWKTVNAGASWILVTSSAKQAWSAYNEAWEGKKILHL